MRRFESLSEQEQAELIEIASGELGDAMDCTRVWEAWYVNTMRPDDFAVIAEDEERVGEICKAIINKFIDMQGAKLKALTHYRDSTVGLFATDKPGELEDKGGLLFELTFKEEN